MKRKANRNRVNLGSSATDFSSIPADGRSTFSRALTLVLVTLGLLIAVVSTVSERPEQKDARLDSFRANIPEAATRSRLVSGPPGQLRGANLRFVLNRGQAGSEAVFHVQGAGHDVLFQPEKIVFKKRSDELATRNEVVLEFPGANRAPIVQGLDVLAGFANFYIGADPAAWRTSVPTYRGVKYVELYPGIDMTYTGDGGTLESEFLVAAQANHARIDLRYRNITSKHLRADGALVLETPLGEIIEAAPFAYQDFLDGRVEVEARYVLRPTGTVGFELGAYDTSHPVVIDPEIIFSTTIQSVAESWANEVVLDGSGDVVIAGSANRFFATSDTIGGSNHVGGLSSDGLLLRLDGSTGDVIYSALFGGSRLDRFNDFAMGSDGTLYLTGLTASTDFPLVNPLQSTRPASETTFLTIIDPAGVVTFSTYLGGTSRGWGEKIAINDAGKVFVVGRTEADDFPFVNGYQQQYNGGDNSGFPSDNFIAKFDATGSIEYVTYLGGSGDDRVCGIAANSSGEATIFNTTTSTDFPVASAYQSAFGGGESDIAITRLSADGTGLVFSTFVGGGGIEECSDAVGGAGGDLFVVGTTTSTDYPVLGGLSNPEADSVDGIAIRLDDLGQPVYSVRSNLPGFDRLDGLDVTPTDTMYAVGHYRDSIWVIQKPPSDSLSTVLAVAEAGRFLGAVDFSGELLALAGADFGTGGQANKSQTGLDVSTLLVKPADGRPPYHVFASVLIEEIRANACPDKANTSWGFLSQGPIAPGDTIIVHGDHVITYTPDTEELIGMIQCSPSYKWMQETYMVTIDLGQDINTLIGDVMHVDAPIEVNGTPWLQDYYSRLTAIERTDSNEPAMTNIPEPETVSDGDATPDTAKRVCALLIAGETFGDADAEATELSLEIFEANLKGEKLGPRIPDASIEVLRTPTVQEVYAAIDAKKGNCDELYVFYEGHGLKAGLVLNATDQRASGISGTLLFRELSKRLFDTEIPELHVLIDACHSGAATKHFERDDRFKDRKVTVVTASSADKSAYGQNLLDADGEKVAVGSSFAFAFMKGFGNPEADTNDDGRTTLGEAFEWTRMLNPVILSNGDFEGKGHMNDVSDPQILTNTAQKATSQNISFPDEDVEVVQRVSLDPAVDLRVTMRSGLDGTDADGASVSALSDGRHWVINAAAQVAPFEMDIVFHYDPDLDFEIGAGDVPGLATRPIQDLGTGKRQADPWVGYARTVWDPAAGTVTAVGVTAFQEWAFALTTGAGAVSVDDGVETTAEFDLHPAYPNPFSTSTRFEYTLPEAARVKITVYDALGRTTRILVDERLPAGNHELEWDGRAATGAAIANGTYLVRMQAGTFGKTQLVTLAK